MAEHFLLFPLCAPAVYPRLHATLQLRCNEPHTAPPPRAGHQALDHRGGEPPAAEVVQDEQGLGGARAALLSFGEAYGAVLCRLPGAQKMGRGGVKGMACGVPALAARARPRRCWCGDVDCVCAV